MTKIESSPTVSVIIPTYNRAHFIGRAIQSVLNQTYPDFEIIIVDDGSTDNTEKVVKSFNDERLRYIRHKENMGAQVARNTGLKAARGEYIAPLDSDDEWLPEKLEKQINKFKLVAPDVGVIYCGYACIIEKTGKTLIEYLPNERGDVFKSAVEGSIHPGGDIPFIRKECFQKAGVFDTEFLSCQDWDMWIRLAKYYKFDFVPEILARCYIHGEQIATSLERQIQGLDRITRKYQNYLSKKLLSNRLQHLGTLCCYQGDFKKASKYFREAISNNPLNIQAYILFLLGKLAPRLYQARLKRLYAQAAEKQGGIILW